MTPLPSVPTEPPRAAFRRRRLRSYLPRFSLRTLFVVAIVVSLIFGWFGKRVYHLRQDEAAIEALQRCGPGIVLGYEPLQWETETPLVAFDDSGATWERLRIVLGLAGRPRLRSAWLHSHDPNDEYRQAGLEALKRFPEIENVGFVGPGFDDAAIDALRELPNLETLSLSDTCVTGAGIAQSRTSQKNRTQFERPSMGFASLKSLRIVRLFGDFHVDRSDFVAIASLPALEEIYLWDVKSSREVDLLSPLENARSLKSLSLGWSGADGIVCEPPRLPNLQYLSLGGVADETLAKWPASPALRCAKFHSPLTHDAVAAFSAAHPDCEVIYFEGNRPSVCYLAGKLYTGPMY